MLLIACAALPLHRHWLLFIGFYTKSIRDSFCATATDFGLTGILMSGKPAVAVLEGADSCIHGFLREVRTVLFACVPPASRKMQSVCEEVIHSRSFTGFEDVTFQSPSDGHVRKDINDLNCLRKYLAARGIDDAIFLELFPQALSS